MISLNDAKTLSEVVQAIGIAIGSLLGGLGALKVLGEWRDKRKHARQKRKWLELYPTDKVDIDFEIMKLDADPVYVCDKRDMTRHWVANGFTLNQLGFNENQIRTVNENALDKYRHGKTIDFKKYDS